MFTRMGGLLLADWEAWMDRCIILTFVELNLLSLISEAAPSGLANSTTFLAVG